MGDDVKTYTTYNRNGFIQLLNEFFVPLFLITICPIYVLAMWKSCESFEGSFLLFFQSAYQHGCQWTLMELFKNHLFGTKECYIILFSYLIWCIILTKILPGKKVYGPITINNQRPEYVDNGFIYYIISLIMMVFTTFILRYKFDLSPTYIYDHLGDMFATLNTFSLIFCLILLIKGIFIPSTPDHGRNSNIVMDYYWGTELYPRIFDVDVKLITNCRFGMLTWALLPVIYGMKEAELNGRVFPSYELTVPIILNLIYLAKFFWWEGGYMNTLDIILDRAGFYLCWGCLVWVPGLYTSPILFNVNRQNNMKLEVAVVILTIGILAIIFNYWADLQKISVRKYDGRCSIWGRPAKIIRAKYRIASTNQEKNSILLISGFWGISRHFHYIPELVLCFCYSFCGGFTHLLPLIYPIFLFVLLMHRAHRDDQKCFAKYGKYWEEYRKVVPYRVIPFVY
ncbi:hypothetical protein SNEBB_002832 [Seison nebaliae]|nr:hypothetical protein SNEBB_002832 [Seison nebaliae]